MIAIMVEVQCIVYLSSLDKVMDIITKFTSMSAMVKFDEMYASVLYENKVKELAGLKLKHVYKRYMGSLYDQI